MSEKCAKDLCSQRVAIGFDDERLQEVAGRIQKSQAHHCVVLHRPGTRFAGLLSLGEIARYSNAQNRILGDLISSVAPVAIGPDETAGSVADLFQRHELQCAVVLDGERNYVGFITAFSVLQWAKIRLDEATARAASEAVLLQAATEAKDKFLSAVSHELRTPLTPAIIISSEAATNAALPEAIRSDFNLLWELLTHQAQLVDQLLEQSDLKRGGAMPLTAGILLDGLVSGLATHLAEAAAAKGITFEVAGLPTAALIRANPGRLTQAFLALADNALKFTPKGGKIQLQVESQTGENEIAISLTDSGIGLTDAELRQAFTPFGTQAGGKYQAKAVPGLGLGLSLAHAIIEIHGGRLQLTSPGRNEGAKVRVLLPVGGAIPHESPARETGMASPPPPRAIGLVYVSAAREFFSAEKLKALLAQSREKNARLGITGLLLHKSGTFMQILEGPEPEVLKLFSAIERDPRHCNVNRLFVWPIERREFANWSMAFHEMAPDEPFPDGFSSLLRGGDGLEKMNLGRSRSFVQTFLSFVR